MVYLLLISCSIKCYLELSWFFKAIASSDCLQYELKRLALLTEAQQSQSKRCDLYSSERIICSTLQTQFNCVLSVSV